MTTWRILSNYRAFGLADAVAMERDHLRRIWRSASPATVRHMALVTVRTALVQSINNGSFYHG